MLFIPRLILIFVLVQAASQAQQYDLFIVAGQSNAQGWRSDAAEYPADNEFLDVEIPFWFNAIGYDASQAWTSLGPQKGHFAAGHFGPEISFARSLKRIGYQPAVFKFSAGSTSLKHDWKGPGQKGLYDFLVEQLQLSIQKLEEAGHQVYPRAFVWIQGESDAENPAMANEYYWHLRKLLHDMRQTVLHIPRLPVILSVDEQHPNVKDNPQVVAAQQRLAKEFPQVAHSSMRGLEKADVTHLTASGTRQQGLRLFQLYQSRFK